MFGYSYDRLSHASMRYFVDMEFKYIDAYRLRGVCELRSVKLTLDLEPLAGSFKRSGFWRSFGGHDVVS